MLYVVQSRSQNTNLCWLIPVWLFMFSLLLSYLFGWLNVTMMFLLQVVTFHCHEFLCFSVCLAFHFPNSFCFFLGLSLVIFSSHITSDAYFRESTKTECTNISLIISDSYNHSLWTRTAHFRNYKVEKQRSNAADFVNTKSPTSPDNQPEPLWLRPDYHGWVSNSGVPCQYFWERFFLIYPREKRQLLNYM